MNFSQGKHVSNSGNSGNIGRASTSTGHIPTLADHILEIPKATVLSPAYAPGDRVYWREEGRNSSPRRAVVKDWDPEWHPLPYILEVRGRHDETYASENQLERCTPCPNSAAKNLKCHSVPRVDQEPCRNPAVLPWGHLL